MTALAALRAEIVALGLPLGREIDTEISGWQPGFIVNVRYGNKRLDPLRERYRVCPGGNYTIIELRPC